MVRIVGLNKKYFPQSNPLDNILTPQAQAVMNKPTVKNPVTRPTPMGTVSYNQPSVFSAIKDGAKVIAEGIRGGGRFAKRTFDNRTEVKKEVITGLDLGVKQTTNSLLGFLSRPKTESTFKSIKNDKPLIDFETKIAPKMREIIEKNNKIITETPRSFPTSGKFLDKIKDPRFVFGVGAQQVPNFGAVLGAGLVGGVPAAIGTGFMLESQAAYEDAKAQGLDEEKSRLAGAGVGFVNSLLEVMPVLKFLDDSPAGQQAKKTIFKYAKDALLKTGVQAIEEGGTEYLQEVTANAVAMTYNENRGLFDNAAESGFFGALTGGGVGAAGAVVSPNIGLSTKDTSDPLEEEARKYKSADEFVKAQGKENVRYQSGSMSFGTSDGKLYIQDVNGKTIVDESSIDPTLVSEWNKAQLNLEKAKGTGVENVTKARNAVKEAEHKIIVQQNLQDSAHRLNRSTGEIKKADGSIYRTSETARNSDPNFMGDRNKANKAGTTADPLEEEARKYKSAEEFVKAQGLYHGTSAEIQGGKLAFGKGGIKKGGQSGGLFLSDTPEVAQVFGKQVYRASPEIKTQVIDLTKPEGIKQIENYIGKTYKTYDGEILKFTRQDFESIFPDGKTDFATVSQFPELIDKIVSDLGKRGIAFNEYAGGKIGKTYQILNGDVPIKTKSQLTDIWNKANKPKAKPVPLQEKISKATTNLQRLGFERDNLDTKFDSKDLEDQYQSFKKLVSLQKLDKIQDDMALKTKLKTNPEAIDNILYSQELNASEVFDMFKERRFQEASQRGEKGRINKEERVVKKELTKLEKVAKARQEKQDLINRVKDIYDKQVAKIKSAKDILARRREFIKAVQKQFELSDNDLKSISQRDIRLMNDFEFKQYLDNIRVKSEQLAVRRQARNALEAQIREKELNIEPLRKAMQLPQIHNMSLGQLVEFDKTLQPYQKGDVFLSQRKQETIHRTELAGIKTYREAREVFNKKHGTNFEAFSAGAMDRMTGNVGLSEKNPFYKEMVEDFYKVMLIKEQEYVEIERETLRLTEAMVKTKSLTERILHKFIPQQKNIAAWFDATDKSTVSVNEAEMALIKHIQKHYIDARDYLIKEKQLNHAIDSDNYFTNLRRNFLESVKEDGLKTAIKEIFTQQKQDEVKFGITDQKTGVILALEKFFPFALSRSGNLKPSENVVGSFLTYMKTFKKKQAIDASSPLIMTYADAFTPAGTTKTGLGIDTSLQTFAKEWLNNQRGRRATLLLKQGGKGEFILRLIKQGISLLYLGGNFTVAAATQVGEQAVTFQLLGNKNFIKAKARAQTKKGKRIIAKYESFIGKNPWSQLVEPARKIGDRTMEFIFILFRDANIRRNKQSLLGMMTPEEYQSETLSPERLAEIRLAVSRYGMVDGAGSVLGATPEFQTALQFRSWATQIFGTSIRNLQYISNWVKSKGKLNPAEAKRAFVEVGRVIEVVSFVSILALWGADDEDEDDMLSKLKNRAYQEATTIMQGANPFTFASVPPLISFLDQLSKNLQTLMKLEVYTTSKFGEYKAGSLKGINHLKKQFTPALMKQFDDLPVKTEQDVAKEILDDLKSGKLDESAAEEKLNNELKKIEAKKKEERFTLTPSEYAQDLLERLKAGEVTEAQAEKELGQYEKKAQETFDSADESSFIDKVVETAKALGTDPITASIFLFEGEKIRRVDNGAIIVERMPVEESQALKKERGATDDLILDHTIPLQLGGSNREKDKLIFLKSNLKLVSKELWESYTPVENYLGDKLRAGMITKKEAQKLIKDFKEGKISKEEVMKK